MINDAVDITDDFDIISVFLESYIKEKKAHNTSRNCCG